MPRHHRRVLLPSYDADHVPCNSWYHCASPPSPPPYTFPSTQSPSPSPSPSSLPPITFRAPWEPWSPPLYRPLIPDLAPSPSPVHDGAGGRRDQGGSTHNYAPPPPGGFVAVTDDHHRRFVTNVLIAAAALAFLSLILLGVSVAVRRRNLRRQQRRQALLTPAPAATTNVGNDDPEGGGGGGGGVVHHVWYIRTVGLDEAAIESIAATRYRAGAGLLGAADCSVCLGEFSDGELLRLLPKCGHAFHVPCIDTWLRAHVNCPLCRSDVIDDPAATPAGVDLNSNPTADPDANANAAAEQVAAASDSTLEHEGDAEAGDQEAPRVEEDRQLGPPEALPQLPCPMPRNVRRAASMDAAMVSTAADVAALDRLPEAAPEGEQSDREKDRTGASATGHLSRFFFSRHCRARSSVLPL